MPLVEPIAVMDVFISGVASVEDIGDGMIRVVFYSKRKNCHDGAFERVIVASLVVSKDGYVRNMFTCAKAMDLGITAEVEKLPTGERLN